jgi:Rrf2 family protein
MAKEPNKMYSAKFLAEELKISDKYLRRMMTNLSKAGFIRSIQGRVGGYTFNKELNKIVLADIIDAVEGLDKYTGCVLGFDECSDDNPCIMHNTWVAVREQFNNVFKNKTLADLKFNDINKF